MSSKCATVYYDAGNMEVNGGQRKVKIIDERGIGWLLFDSMKKFALEGKIAQIDSITGRKDSFKDLLQRCVRTSVGLKTLGIQRGDIISICSNNHLNTIVPLVASYFIGAIPAPTDPSLSVEDTKHLLKLVKPKIIFTAHDSAQLIEDSLRDLELSAEIILFSYDEKIESIELPPFNTQEEINAENDFAPEICNHLKDTCLILFSSGTTGLPKGICLNHLFIMNAISGAAAIKDAGVTYLGFASLYWISSIMFVASCLTLGYQRLICPVFKPETIWDLIEKYQVDFLFIAPNQAIKTIPYLSDKGKALKHMMIGGGIIAPDFLQQLRNSLPNTFIMSGYGQTEIGFIAGLKEKDENYDKLETCGHPVSGLSVKIVDPETEQPLGLNKTGEIRVMSEYPLNGYYNSNSSDIWDADGYVKTGDLGYFDDDLCLFITDRIKEIFKYMAYHIVPAKLEKVLMSHAAVELAVVIGIPHPIDDNHALGIVTLIPDAKATAEELELYVEEHVDDMHRLRAGVLIINADNLPMTPTSKVKRRTLKEIMNKKILMIRG